MPPATSATSATRAVPARASQVLAAAAGSQGVEVGGVAGVGGGVAQQGGDVVTHRGPPGCRWVVCSPSWSRRVAVARLVSDRTASGVRPMRSAVSGADSPSTWRSTSAVRCRSGSAATAWRTATASPPSGSRWVRSPRPRRCWARRAARATSEVAVGQVGRHPPGPPAGRVQLRHRRPLPTGAQQRLLGQLLGDVRVTDVQRQGPNQLRPLGSAERRRVGVRPVWSCHGMVLVVPVTHHTHEPPPVCHAIFASTV